MHCPTKALFCDEEDSFGVGVEGEVQEVVREGLVEGKPAKVLLDTGSARTLVRSELVQGGKVLVGQEVAIRCAHGESVRYPLADIDVEVGGRQFVVRAGVADQLPVQILLGRDVPMLLELLTEDPSARKAKPELAAVTTRSQLRRVRVAEASEPVAKDQVVVEPIAKDQVVEPIATDQVVVDDEPEGDNLSMDFADDLFEGGRERPQLTRSQKRATRHEHATEHWTSDPTGISSMMRDQLIECQLADATLEAARAEAAEGGDTACDPTWGPLGEAKNYPTGYPAFLLADGIPRCGRILSFMQNLPIGFCTTSEQSATSPTTYYIGTIPEDRNGHRWSTTQESKWEAIHFSGM